MKRREFITLVGSAAATWPLAARAQQALPVVGYIDPASSGLQGERNQDAFRQGLKETGFIEGRNVTVEYYYGESQPDRARAIAADLARRKVAAIASVGGPGMALIAKAATSTIPIIFEVGSNPVQYGLVASLSHPGGNITGVNSLIGELWPKQIDLLAKLLPNSRVFGALITGATATAALVEAATRASAEAVGRKLVVARAATPDEFDAAFATVKSQGAEALVIGASPLALSQADQLAALAARFALPAIYAFREIPRAGGLMSYGIEIGESYHLVGVYTGRVLKGEKPSDLPVVQATRFVLVINLKAAKALGLTVPEALLAITDEVIE
jgi:putative tryptophan/tyrosine transport system substrate-binding protein